MTPTRSVWRPRPPTPGHPYGYPDWFHHHGTKMRVEQIDIREKVVAIAGSAARLTIKPCFIPSEHRYWKIEYSVRQSREEVLRGTVLMKDDQLAAAFNVKKVEIDPACRWLIDRYGGDYAYQGRCIRYEEFLNIPCPGTAHDGDPNISIELNPEMTCAVAALLNLKSSLG